MNFFSEDIVWIVTIVIVLQIIKLTYHWRLIREIKKKKSNFNRYLRKLKSLIVD